MNRTAFTAVCATALAVSAFAASWDFTAGGCPKGLLPHENASFGRDGLSAKSFKNVNTPGGCTVKSWPGYPEAFRFEAEFATPASNASPGRIGILWDDMRVNYGDKRPNRGLQLVLERRQTSWTPRLYIGFDGRSTSQISGPKRVLEPGRVVRLSFIFDANGRVVWDFDGEAKECFVTRPGAFTSNEIPPKVGDRAVSMYQPFEGILRRVTLEAIPRETIAILPAGRMAFVRGESDAKVRLAVMNISRQDVTGVRANVRTVTSDGYSPRSETLTVGTIPAGGETVVTVPVETRLRTGVAKLEIALTGREGTVARTLKRDVAYRIGPQLGDIMPAVIWGVPSVAGPASYGFNHALRYYFGFHRPLRETDNRMVPIRVLDEAVALGVRIGHKIEASYPNDTGLSVSNYWRRTRNGNPNGGIAARTKRKHKAQEVSNPDFAVYGRKVAQANLEVFGDHPGFGSILPVSEERDWAFPSFATEHERYFRETGRRVPDEVCDEYLEPALGAKLFPGGLVPDDHPILAYYRWYWKGGDGWPGYTSAIADEYAKVRGRFGDKSKMQKDRPFFSFWDPAVRCPAIWGSGGNCDFLNQWDYAVPDPLNVAGPAEEMFAMAAGRPGQGVMMMTQLICYRSSMAPKEMKIENPPAWTKEWDEAPFPTIPPDILQEATWAMLAKPVKGIMYHGWDTIFNTGYRKYCYTCPESAARIQQLLKGPVRELGPTLKRLGRRPSPVAILESATTFFMSGLATFGWETPAISYFQRARLDPRVVYEEAVLRGALDGVKVLYAPECIYLPVSVVEKIKAFQSRGGILVADSRLPKALRPDIVVPVVASKPRELDDAQAQDALMAAVDASLRTAAVTRKFKEDQLAAAEKVRKRLAERGYRPPVDSTDGDLVVFSRQHGPTPYVFVINDHRTFGDYVGQWGLVMEKGLPFKGAVTMRDSKARCKAVYELTRGGRRAFSRTSGGEVCVPVDFETNDARLLMMLTEPIADVKLAVADGVRPGGMIDITATVVGESGKTVPAQLPVEIRVEDAAGRAIDGTGWTCAENGVAHMSVQTSLDDAPGSYTITVTDRASGLSAKASCRLIK